MSDSQKEKLQIVVQLSGYLFLEKNCLMWSEKCFFSLGNGELGFAGLGMTVAGPVNAK
ncbi:hypothetical protein BAU18_000304 [Enterococcus diestrammenae]|uniref:Uncharacterized protein n=1 Tax=Enterococcus diestrammenae TaxID=1155073 RepID=A0ABV0EY72_9ENTE